MSPPRQGIREHAWFNGPLPPKMQDALAAQAEEQRLRERMARAAVSRAL
jgi:hypothetical protein